MLIRTKNKKLSELFSEMISKKIVSDRKLLKDLIDGCLVTGLYLYVDLAIGVNSIDELKKYNFLKKLFIDIVKKNNGMFDTILNTSFMALFSEKLFCPNIYMTTRDTINTLLNYYKSNDINFKIGLSYGEILIGNIFSNENQLSYIYGGNASINAMKLCNEANNSVIIDKSLENYFKFDYKKNELVYVSCD